MRNRLLQTENLSIEKHTKLRMLNLVIALILLFGFVAMRIYRIQHQPLETTNRLVINSDLDNNTRNNSRLPLSVRITKVEEQYAHVSFKQQQFWLEKTGVLPIHVNDEEISKTALKDGDIVRIDSTLMWFQTSPSMMNRCIIYRQTRRDTLKVTFGNPKCDIVMSVPIDQKRSGNNRNSRLMTLTFHPDRYVVTAHSEIPVKLPFRETSIEKGSRDFEASDSSISAQELLILGSVKIVFSYLKGQKVVEIAVLEEKEEPCSIWQAQLTIPKTGQQISLSKEHPLAITKDIPSQPSGIVASAKEMFLRNSLKFYTAIIVVGFISFPLARRRKVTKYLIFWFVTFWAVLGSAIIFGDSQSDKIVEEDFLNNVKTAIDRKILFLDSKNRIQLKNANSLKSNTDAKILSSITTQGRDIHKFIKSHNNFIQSNGKSGQDWFLVDQQNRQISGLKREAVTIKNFSRLRKKTTRGRFLDRDGKSVAKLKVIEANNKSLRAGAEIWLGIPQIGQKFRKDIICFADSQNKKRKVLLNIGKLEIVLRDGKLGIDNERGDQDLTWYTKIKVSSKGKIYDYPVLRKIRPDMVFSIDYDEGWGIMGNEEIAINQNDNQIRFSNLIIVDSEKCFEINTSKNFPKSSIFENHLSITKRSEVYYVQNLGINRQQIFVGGQILMPEEERELHPHDFIRIGDLLLEYIPTGNGLLAGNLDKRRYYPIDLSQTIGYFCYPDLKGNLEKTFDRILLTGEDIILTIDDDLQRIVIDELKLGLRKSGLQIGTVVLLDVETGDILAMVSEPSYDQNSRSGIFSAFRTDRTSPRKSPILNRALHKLYPPGSFFKIVVASAALQNASEMPEVRDFIGKPFSHDYITRKVVLSSETPSKRHIYAIHPLKDHDHKIHEGIDIYEALAESCNVYFAGLAIQLGYNSLNKAYYPPRNPLYKFAEEAYLFNENIDLLPLQKESDLAQKRISDRLNRQTCDVLNPFASEMSSNKLHPSDLSRVGIGQFDIRITPLEAAFILSIIANDGIRQVPRLVKAVREVTTPLPRLFPLNKGGQGVVKEERSNLTAPDQIGEAKFAPPKGKRVISSQTARELKTMMKKVVTDGTAEYEFKYSKLNDCVAGKTGTPTALDMASKYHAIFGAIAPTIKQSNKPQVALVVFVEYGESAGIAAVPIARRILEKVAIYYGWK